MSLSRTCLALAVVAVAATASPSSAEAPRTLVMTDPAGDANSVNGQSVVPGIGDHTGPTQKDDADLLAVTLAALGSPGPDCTGFTITIDLAVPPGESTVYRVAGKGRRNAEQFWVEHEILPSGSSTTVRYRDEDRSGVLDLAPAAVDGTRILITVPGAALERTGEKLASFSMKQIGVDVRTSTGEITAPAWDVIDEDPTRSFAPCRRR